ncbi:MAG: DHH family phosphoesterase [Patescibacteria group bacterium]|nr:DHH family phosphoesterase [Patescibacteria group bacterium]
MLNLDQQILKQIKKANNILITFKKTWNGDAIASSLAFYLLLKKMDKNATIAAECFDESTSYNFLPSFDLIQNSLNNLRKFIVSVDITNTQVRQIKYKIKNDKLNFIISPKGGFFSSDDVKTHSGEFKYNLIITIDTPDLEALGAIYDNDTEFFYQVPLINIDHHPNNESYGQINLIELTAVSSAEILFNLFTNISRDLIDEDIATCLLAGIISKTRSFKTQNVTPQALSASSQLVAIGGRRQEIVNRLYRSRSINILKLWGRILARLKSEMNNKLIWSVLAETDFQKTNTDKNDLNDVIDELMINIPDAKIIVLIYETTRKKNKESEILIYSTKTVNSLNLVKEYKPGGTKQLAKIKIKQGINNSEKEIIEKIKLELNKLSI